MLGSEPESSVKAGSVALEPFLQPLDGESFNILISGGWVAGLVFVLFCFGFRINYTCHSPL